MGKVIVVGLGAGDINQLPFGVYQLLKSGVPIYLRTALHPAVQELEAEGIHFERSFDALYEEEEKFEEVYEEIVKQLLNTASHQDLIYAVPGHPMVAEKTVQLLLGNQLGIPVEIAGGQSFLDDFFTAVKIDPVEGFQLLDALDLDMDTIELGQHVIIMQIFDEFVASDVKLVLSEKYPYDYQVALVHQAGSKEEKVEWLPLLELDQMQGVHNLTSLYVPPLARDERVTAFSTLQSYIDEITEKDIWLKEQTDLSLLRYLKEETQEVIEAIENEDVENTVEELGDILLQVLYQAAFGEREGLFSFEEIVATLARKLRRRHPHVFDEVEVTSIEELDQMWQHIKQQEKEGKNNETR